MAHCARVSRQMAIQPDPAYVGTAVPPASSSRFPVARPLWQCCAELRPEDACVPPLEDRTKFREGVVLFISLLSSRTFERSRFCSATCGRAECTQAVCVQASFLVDRRARAKLADDCFMPYIDIICERRGESRAHHFWIRRTAYFDRGWGCYFSVEKPNPVI